MTLVGEQVNKLTWASELAHLSRTKSLKIFHAISWNIFDILVFHVANFKWHGKIFDDMSCNILPRHQNIFWNQQRFITLNMGLLNKAFKSSFMWKFQNKRKQKYTFHNPWCNQYSTMSKGQKNYLIFKIVKLGGNCMVDKYLWNGKGIMIVYTKSQYTKKHIMTIKSFIAIFMNEKITIDLI
jgi:hypothetical protein